MMGCSDRDDCNSDIIVFLPIEIAQVAAGLWNAESENSLRKDILYYFGFMGKIHMPDKAILRFDLHSDISYPVYWHYGFIRDFANKKIINLMESDRLDQLNQFLRYIL